MIVIYINIFLYDKVKYIFVLKILIEISINRLLLVLYNISEKFLNSKCI